VGIAAAMFFSLWWLQGNTLSLLSRAARNSPTTSIKKNIRIMLLGDSLIALGTIQEKMRTQLSLDLKQYSFTFVGSQWHRGVASEGHGGFTTGNVLRDLTDGQWNNMGTIYPGKFKVDLPKYKPDLVVIQLGTNDARDSFSSQKTIENMSGIIDSLRKANGTVKIIIGRVPRLKNAVHNKRAGDINKAFVALSNRKSTTMSPVKLADDPGLVSSDLQNDGIHPNPAGDQKLVNKYIDILKPTLSR
jgi:lysophospholipase L1-like esterase